MAPAYAETNVSILYGWNGTNFVPVQVTGGGAIKTDINLTQSSGLTPKVNNTYDLGSTAFLWANLYVRSVRGGSGPLSLFAGGTELVTLLANGNVGINTTSPTSALQVTGNVSVSGVITAVGYTGNAENLTNLPFTNVSLNYGWNTTNFVPLLTSGTGILKLSITEASATNASNLLAGANGTSLSLSGNLTVLKNLSVGTTTLFVDQTVGRIGIKTASPTALLDIAGTNIVNNLSLSVNNTLYVNASGRVGIGVTSPASTLEVAGTANITGGLNVSAGGLNVVGGNVGIGTTSPNYKLDVNGVINASGVTINGTSLSSPVKSYTPVLNNASNTLSQITVLNFTVPANDMADFNIMDIHMAYIAKQNTGAAKRTIYNISWGSVSAIDNQSWNNYATENNNYGYLRMIRVGSDLWIVGLNSSFAGNALWQMLSANPTYGSNVVVVSSANFTSDQYVTVSVTFDHTDVNTYLKPQKARVYKYGA